MQDMAKRLFQVELLKKRQDGLETQKAELISRKSKLVQLLDDKRKMCTEEEETFFRNISEFNDEYGLLSNRELVVENRAKLEISNLEKEVDILKNEMKSIEHKNVQLNAFQSQRNELKEGLVQLHDYLKDLKGKLNEARCSTKRLEAEKAKIQQKPQTDPDFLRLKKELEMYKDDDMENVYEALRTEIQFLQMKLSQQCVETPTNSLPWDGPAHT
nr:PREDICTED: coiled-coil domain-containing protein 172 [Latimeria chalumnae]|eukprot:XP_014343730.1 PREDICTED: coiled-coil domain-containing protein 172 [Latimeria chalumnae]